MHCCIVQLLFSSYSSDDEDYEGYDYSLIGKLSEVRIVYLNRFIQEVTDLNFLSCTWLQYSNADVDV